MQGYLSCYYYLFFLFCFVKTKHLHLDVHQRLFCLLLIQASNLQWQKFCRELKGNKVVDWENSESFFRTAPPLSLLPFSPKWLHSIQCSPDWVLCQQLPAAARAAACLPPSRWWLSSQTSLQSLPLTQRGVFLESLWHYFPGLEGRWFHRDTSR